MKKLVCVILSAALLFCLSSCGQKPKIRREIDNSKLLRVSEDGYLTDGSDNGIQLRGVNFGGWLLQETWMCPVMSLDRSLTVKGGTDDGWAELDTLNKFTLLFGKKKPQSFLKATVTITSPKRTLKMLKLSDLTASEYPSGTETLCRTKTAHT